MFTSSQAPRPAPLVTPSGLTDEQVQSFRRRAEEDRRQRGLPSIDLASILDDRLQRDPGERGVGDSGDNPGPIRAFPPSLGPGV